MTRTEFRAKVVDELGEDFAYSYFDRSKFKEGADPVLFPWSGVAAERWRTRARQFLKDAGVRLGERMQIGEWKSSFAGPA
jgi:hypothetical protein